MSSNKPYRNIATLTELRAAREKLRWQMRSQEDILSRDWQGVVSALSFQNIVRTAFSKLDNIKALIGGVRDGYRSISGLFHDAKKDSGK